MNIKPCYPITRLFLPLIFSLVLFSCVSDQQTELEEGEEMSLVSDFDLIQPVALEVISNSGATLMSALYETMDTAGVKEAIVYCNLNANEIVTTLSAEYGVEIKRTSLQLRNRANKPTEDEKLILDFYANQESMGKTCVGEMSQVEGNYKYYHPIYVMDKCTQCHGIKGETLNKKAAKQIAELYPDDQATGYSTGDLRGMWVVNFTK